MLHDQHNMTPRSYALDLSEGYKRAFFLVEEVTNLVHPLQLAATLPSAPTTIYLNALSLLISKIR